MFVYDIHTWIYMYLLVISIFWSITDDTKQLSSVHENRNNPPILRAVTSESSWYITFELRQEDR